MVAVVINENKDEIKKYFKVLRVAYEWNYKTGEHENLKYNELEKCQENYFNKKLEK